MLRTVGTRSINQFRSLLVGTSRKMSCGGGCNNNSKTVDYDVVKKMSCNNCGLIIDVRCPQELKETGQIPNSINIPLPEFKEAMGDDMCDAEFKKRYCVDKPDKCDDIVTTCKCGEQSKEAMEIAECLGYTNVKHYKGSWNDWAKREGL